MTQDPYGQPPGPGYVVRGEVVPDDDSGVPPTGQPAPMTHFQKVASAARPDQAGQADPADPADPAGQAAGQPEDEAAAEEDRAVSSPDAGHGDYWDDGEDSAGAEPAADLATAPAEGPAATGTEPPAAAGEADGQAEQPAGEAPADGHEATGPSITQPTFTATAPPAGAVPTVPIAVAEPAADGGQPAEPAAAEAELRPGESGTTLPFGESGYASLLPDTADIRAQWHRIQYAFVDDPGISVTQAADVIAQVSARIEAAITERQRGLRARWDSSPAADTETLRETLRMYRSLLDQLIGPEPN
jgi:hypothetical protein